MEKNRGLKGARVGSAAAVVFAVLTLGCGLIGRTKPKSSESSISPYDSPLRVVSVQPGAETIATSPRLKVRFNEFLQDDSFTSFNTGTLASGGLSWGGWADYVVTDRALVWETRDAVPEQLEVQFSLAERLRSVTGAKLANRQNVAAYTTRADTRRLRRDRPDAPRWSDVDAIFDERCNDCHAEPSWGLVRLEPDALVGVESAQIDRLLVKPYDPADSYLLQKLLWNYPDIRRTPQPPPWTGAGQIPRRELLTIERWIEVGAPD